MRVLLCLLVLLLPMQLAATSVQTGYREPPAEVVALVDMAPPVTASASPDGRQLLLMTPPALPSLADLAEPELRLAGLRFNPANHAPAQARYFSDLQLISTDGDGQPTSITGLPDTLRVLAADWSPDGAHIALLHIEADAVELWRVDVASATAQRWSDKAIHAAWNQGWGSVARTFLEWSPNSQSVIVRSLPESATPPAQDNRLPTGPVVTESRGRSAPARTFQDLLGNSHDERLFEHHFTTQLYRIDLDGSAEAIGQPGLLPGFSPSPDGEYLLVMRLTPPWSYAVPFSRFAHSLEIWSRTGEPRHRLADLPLADDLPIAFDAVIEGPRSPIWRGDADATLMWVEAADGGNPAIEADDRDHVFQLRAPFTAEPRRLMSSPYRVRWILAGDSDNAVIWQRWWANRSERVSHIAPDRADQDATLLWERRYEERYGDPGTPATFRDDRGQTRLLLDKGALFLFGQGASPEGNRPFVDRFTLSDRDSERLWQSESPYLEQPLSFLGGDHQRLLTQREAAQEPPDFFTRDLLDDRLERLTYTPHPLPAMRDIHRELISYEREDGVLLSATLLLPAGYDAERDGPLPTVVWAYPREFLSADAAGQIADSPYRFNRLSYWSAQFLATQGFAVLDNATMPVIAAEGLEPNDRFVEELTLNARAAIDAGVSRGVTDPERVAIGGHSYGAFMTASLLAHTDLFRTGIARSGAYNRTLTPFGFQSEQRTLWDDTELYIEVSPFFHVHRMTEPLLIIHGMEDNNSGTFPMQSERLYQAIRGLGGTARLVMLPLESHGYRARESVLHMLWETLSWLDEHLSDDSAD
ncbi:MAG: prolyl oligopeptidase family serine peptidase [Wenzhouxiangella sp.]